MKRKLVKLVVVPVVQAVVLKVVLKQVDKYLDKDEATVDKGKDKKSKGSKKKR